MMSGSDGNPNGIPEPTETVYLAGPSWAPAMLAVGILGLVSGIFASGFVFPSWIYAVAGAILVLGALHSMVWRGVHSFFRLPRRQDAPASVLPVDSFDAPKQG